MREVFLFDEMKTLFAEAGSVLIATHKSPDPDAAGSALGLAAVLAARYDALAIQVYAQDPCPRSASFLPGVDLWTTELPQAAPDLVVITDCNHPSRVGDDFVAWEKALRTDVPRLVLDHHIVDHPWGTIPYVDVACASATQVVFDMATHLGWPVTAAQAECLYTGLMTDTGSFRHSNTSAAVFAMAGELVAAGADPSSIAGRVFANEHPGRILLTGKVLDTLQVGAVPAGAVNSDTWASVMMLEHFWEPEAIPADIVNDDFVDYPRAIEGVAVAFQIKERPAEGGCKVSMRSTPAYNVQKLVSKFGGGGHRQAAGCFVSLDAEQTHQLIVREVEAMLWGDNDA